MIVVSDTSPILNLAIVHSLPLLQQLYGEIIIPPAVGRELLKNGVHPEFPWLCIVAADDQDAVAALREELDPGEAEANCTNSTERASIPKIPHPQIPVTSIFLNKTNNIHLQLQTPPA